jgi:hypothetical protein
MAPFSILFRASSNRKKRRFRRGTSPSRSLSARVRLSVECLEDRTLLSNGQWLTHITGLPGDTTEVQIAAAKVLLHNAGLDGPSPVASRSSVQVIDHMGADGILLIQTETNIYGKTIDQAGLTSELQVVPGFDYVEAYDPNDDPDSRRSWFPVGPNQEHDGGGPSSLIHHSSPPAVTDPGPTGPPLLAEINGFDGITGVQGGNSRPPDSMGAVGPSTFIEEVNLALAIYDKTTGLPISGGGITPIHNFFASINLPGDFTGDPVVVYNDITGKFGVGGEDFNHNYFYFGISRTSNPTLNGSDWDFFRYNLNDGGGGADYPKMGYNADGFVVSFNMFPSGFTHSSILAIKNDGTSTGNHQVAGGITHFTFGPASMHGSLPGDPMWLTETPGASGNSSGNTVRVVRMDDPYSATPTFTYTTLNVNAYFGTSNAHQPGGLISGNANLGTRMYFSDFRNVGGVTHLVAAHTVADTSGGFNRVHWYDFDLTNPATPTLIQQGEINPGANIDVLMPCMAINPSGTIGLQYMETSGSEFVSMYFTGRASTDAPGTMQTPVLAKAGVGNLNPSDRIGDYSFTSVDPVDGTFWGVNEYGGNTGNPNWRTWIEHFQGQAPAGPSVISQAPTNAVGQVSSLRLTFDESILVSSFTADKIRSFTDPAGNAIAVADANITPVSGSNDTQFDISFAPQTTLGVYTILVGPNVLDTFGHPMDQNHNGIPGEDPGDIYTGTFAVHGLRVISSTPSGTITGPVDHIEVTFNQAVDPTTFTTASIVSFTGPSGAITPTNVSAADGTNTVFDVSFDPQSAPGDYTMVLSETIQDTFGNQMDQNDNFIPGENPDDRYTAQFSITSEALQNGGFETGDFTAWTVFNPDGFVSVSTANPHTGNFAAKMGTAGQDGSITQTIATTPGQHYTFSFWHTCDGGTPNDFSALFGGVTVYSVTNEGAHDYVQSTFDVVATGTSTDVQLKARNDPGYDYLDDVSVMVGGGGAPYAGAAQRGTPISGLGSAAGLSGQLGADRFAAGFASIAQPSFAGAGTASAESVQPAFSHNDLLTSPNHADRWWTANSTSRVQGPSDGSDPFADPTGADNWWWV